MKNKKKLVFTHGIDIDGYGCAILAKLAWGENVDIVYADNFDLDENFVNLWKKGGFNEYDKIFVTDHCLGLELCNKVDKDEALRNKIQIFDHHSSRVGSQDQFPWVHIVVEKNGKRECGTSLFYEFLSNHNLIHGNPHHFQDWVNLTRLYDTWEWTKIGEKNQTDLTPSPWQLEEKNMSTL